MSSMKQVPVLVPGSFHLLDLFAQTSSLVLATTPSEEKAEGAGRGVPVSIAYPDFGWYGPSTLLTLSPKYVTYFISFPLFLAVCFKLIQPIVKLLLWFLHLSYPIPLQ